MSEDILEGDVLDEAVAKDRFRAAKFYVVPIGKKYKFRTIDDTATSDEGLRWLHYVYIKNIARDPFKVHLEVYLKDRAIRKELENLGLEMD